MASHFAHLLLITAVLFVFIHEGATSRKCYICTTASQGSRCGSWYNVSTTNLPTQKCYKNEDYCGVLEETRFGRTNITRSCATKSFCNNNQNSTTRACRTCKKDLCNSSVDVLPSFVLGVISLGFTKFYSVINIF